MGASNEDREEEVVERGRGRGGGVEEEGRGAMGEEDDGENGRKVEGGDDMRISTGPVEEKEDILPVPRPITRGSGEATQSSGRLRR